jgi:hypothetical protein
MTKHSKRHLSIRKRKSIPLYIYFTNNPRAQRRQRLHLHLTIHAWIGQNTTVAQRLSSGPKISFQNPLKCFSFPAFWISSTSLGVSLNLGILVK